MRTRCLKGNKDIIADRVGDRRDDDTPLRNDLGCQLAADAAKVVAIKNVSLAVLTKRQ